MCSCRIQEQESKPFLVCSAFILFLFLSSAQLLPYYSVPAPVLSIAASQLFCYPFYFPLYSSPSPFLNVGGIGVILLFLVHFILVLNITFHRINVLEVSPQHTQSLSFFVKIKIINIKTIKILIFQSVSVSYSFLSALAEL